MKLLDLKKFLKPSWFKLKSVISQKVFFSIFYLGFLKILLFQFCKNRE